jgi:hypothetical protein
VTTKVPESVLTGRKIREFTTEYGMYPEKLDLRTWSLLETAGLVRLAGPDEDYYARPMTGFLLMSLLADAYAGTTKEKITDRADAYQFMGKMVAAERVEVPDMDRSKLSSAQLGLVSMAIRTVRTDGIPFENILAMRKREAGSRGHHYRRLRESFAGKIDVYAKKSVLAVKRRKVETVMWVKLRILRIRLSAEEILVSRQMAWAKFH